MSSREPSRPRRGRPARTALAAATVCPDRRPRPGRVGQLAGPRHLSELFAQPRFQPARWYGSSPAWRILLEAAARRTYGRHLEARLAAGQLTYTVGLDVPGRLHPVPVAIRFYDIPPYNCYGLSPADYPRVHAEPGGASPHRMPTDNALCLWYPRDPPERRWTVDKGLLDLLGIITSHLLYEAHWRATGGDWAGDEAPHGFPEQGTAA